MTSNPFLTGNFAPVPDETTAFDLSVRGRVPDELAGRLLRIGPNPIAPSENYHWFLGNGMVHGVALREGRARWYRSRFVRDDELCAARGWPKVPGPRFSELSTGGANTNVIHHAGRIYAIVEAGGNPVELDDELETVASSDFEGTLPGPFSAHPKRCPDTNELHVMGYYPGWEHLQYVVVAADGRVRKTVDIPVPDRPMIHDCALTENYFIVFDLPVILDLEGAEAGSNFPYRWSNEHPTRVGLLPRDGSAEDILWNSVEPCFLFHPLNAYEDEAGRVVLDVVRHPRLFDPTALGSEEGTPTLDRWIVDPTGGPVKESRLCDRPQEFPRIDERRTAKPHRYGYCGAPGDGGSPFGGLLKHDLERGETLHRDEAGYLYQEAVFVPRSPDSDEDDGYLMAYAHHTERDASEVVILHAQDFLGEPVARVELPVRVPFGFHGNWVSDA
ncbi:MAG: carotenoid oxygenase family protein [Myxococcales bacterium]|nr:carotenoid oxygenase family protein [Myxococcales bacterium]